MKASPLNNPTDTGDDRRWPSWLRRRPAEMAACALIALGVFMLLQPFSMQLYTWSFVTTLAGTVLFMVVSKFPR